MIILDLFGLVDRILPPVVHDSDLHRIVYENPQEYLDSIVRHDPFQDQPTCWEWQDISRYWEGRA